MIPATAASLAAVTFDSSVKFVHVALAIVVFAFHAAYGLWLAGGSDAQVLPGLKRLGGIVVVPGYVLLFVTGAVLVVRGPWDFTTGWVAFGIVLSIVGMAVFVAAYLPALRSQRSRHAALGGAVSALLVVVVGFLMITKPT